MPQYGKGLDSPPAAGPRQPEMRERATYPQWSDGELFDL